MGYEDESKKRQVMSIIFEKHRKADPNGTVLKFNNNEVKEVSTKVKFRNQFDAVKIDTTKLLPENMKKAGFFIVHLGGKEGWHAFVKGEGYHKFETIKTIKEWKVGKSVIDEISQSEAQSASTAFNDKIIHDFLFEDIKKDIKLHTARRSKTFYDFVVNGKSLRTGQLQIEMDGIYESGDDKTIAAVEVKNQEHEDFEIRQLFSTMKYFEKMKGWKIPNDYKIRLLFMIRVKKGSNDKFKIYEYDFEDKSNPNSIKFVKAVKYDIVN